jgi:hypothetical protein
MATAICGPKLSKRPISTCFVALGPPLASGLVLLPQGPANRLSGTF